MTKMLNLDALETTIDQAITVQGQTHFMKPMTVEQFIAQMKEINDAGEKTLSAIELYELTLNVIMRAFPTLPEEDLRGLTTFQVDKLYAFLKGEIEEEAEAGAEAAGEGN